MADSENTSSEWEIGAEILVGENSKKKKRKTSALDFTEKTWRTDFVLIVEGTKLYVAKNILSIASPVFDTMFESDFKESSCDSLELPGKKLDDVKEFLRCIYPSTCTKITSDNALNVLPLIEEYQVLPLKEKCEDVLMEVADECIPVEELFRYLRDACLYDLQGLRERCISIAADKSEHELDEASRKCPLPPEAAKEMLEEINRRLRVRINYLERTKEDVSNSAATLKRKNEELEEDQSILEQYLSAELRRTKEIKLDSENNWQGKHIVLAVDIESAPRAATEVTIWDTPLLVQANIHRDNRSGKDRMMIGIKNSGRKNIVCALKIRIIYVNRQPKGHNEVYSFAVDFSTSRQRVGMFTKTKDELMNDENGLVLDGKIGLIVQVYMTQPNK